MMQRSSLMLLSWNDGPAKKAIVDFVGDAVRSGGPRYLAPDERVAVFDNDGTLWLEQPLAIQALFAVDRVRALAPHRPAWEAERPFSDILSHGATALAGMDERAVVALLAATHTGMTTGAFSRVVKDWLATARHPTLGRPIRDCVYRPMSELLAHLRDHGFVVYIVTGGGLDFVRAVAEDLYGVEPAQVVGSSVKLRYQVQDGRAELTKLPEIDVVDDGAGKPINIALRIGRRPALAFGNSDGDLEMLQYTAAAPRPGLALLLHHDDGEREVAYDRDVKVGRLDKALSTARRDGWTVVSMRHDWRSVLPAEQR